MDEPGRVELAGLLQHGARGDEVRVPVDRERRPVRGEQLLLERLDLASGRAHGRGLRLARPGERQAQVHGLGRRAGRSRGSRGRTPAGCSGRTRGWRRRRPVTAAGRPRRARARPRAGRRPGAPGAGRSRRAARPPCAPTRPRSPSRPGPAPPAAPACRRQPTSSARAARRRWRASRRRPSREGRPCARHQGLLPLLQLLPGLVRGRVRPQERRPSGRSRPPGGPAPAPSARARRAPAGRPRRPRGPRRAAPHDAQTSPGAPGFREFPAGGGGIHAPGPSQGRSRRSPACSRLAPGGPPCPSRTSTKHSATSKRTSTT